MLLKIPTRSLDEEILNEHSSIEIQGDLGQVKKLQTKMDQIRNVISYCDQQSKPITDILTLRISVSFLTKYHSEFKEIALRFLKERMADKPKYPVHLQFLATKRSKLLLEQDLSFLGSSYRFTVAEYEEPWKISELILMSFLAVELNQKLFSDFVSSFIKENSGEAEPEEEGKVILKKEVEERVEVKKEMEDSPAGHCQCCGVCGAEIETGPFSYYGAQFTKLCSTPVCQKCIKFYEMSENRGGTAGWRCLQQSGYCGLRERFEYSTSQGRGILLYPAEDGTLRQYVSNCNVLCRLCRYARCLQIGLSTQGSQTEAGRCLVCGSQQGLNSLSICGCCQEFLTDSVSESSHSSMTCIKSGVCQVTPAKTESFSACPGCWMSRLRSTGVLLQYLSSRPQAERDESEKENTEKCEVCERTEATEKYKDTALCLTCKKFFLKCVKSLCYKDFCCGSPGSRSACELGVRLPCQHCWWGKCVKVGLYLQFQKARVSAAKRHSAA